MHRVLLTFAGLDESLSVFKTREVGCQPIARLCVDHHHCNGDDDDNYQTREVGCQLIACIAIQ